MLSVWYRGFRSKPVYCRSEAQQLRRVNKGNRYYWLSTCEEHFQGLAASGVIQTAATAKQVSKICRKNAAPPGGSSTSSHALSAVPRIFKKMPGVAIARRSTHSTKKQTKSGLCRDWIATEFRLMLCSLFRFVQPCFLFNWCFSFGLRCFLIYSYRLPVCLPGLLQCSAIGNWPSYVTSQFGRQVDYKNTFYVRNTFS